MTTIHVTQRDIHDGISVSCGQCPIALAVDRVIRSDLKTRVRHTIDITRPRVFLGQHEFIVQLVCHHTSKSGPFVSAFDNGRAVSPFSFDLDIPARLLRTA